MSDPTIKTIFYFLIAILTIYPIVELLIKNKKPYIKIIAGIGIAFFWYVSCKYKTINDTEANQAKIKSDSLQTENSRKDSVAQIKEDNTKALLDTLKEKFNIVIDENGKPKLINNTYNTHINKADRVKIGG